MNTAHSALVAIVYVLSEEFDPHATRCIAYIEERGYRLGGIVKDNWRAVLDAIAAGQADIVVVSEESHLDPKRQPRIEVVAHQVAVPRTAQRTRVIKRAWVR